MAIKWNALKERHATISDTLSSGNLDNKKRLTLQKELSHLSDLVEKHTIITQIERELADAQGQVQATDDAELASLFKDEVVELTANLEREQGELEELLFPPNKHDNRSVYLEIRAGTGGKEAALFVADLLKMYMGYAQRKYWKTSIDRSNTTDLGGFKDVVLHIKGKDVYGHLKQESGVHRVQRVPATESAGRVHTSTATVAILPEAKAVDVTINPADLRIDVFRASGAGGQHVNTTDSAVRITHIPTGVVVSCQDERSQHKNKAKAMKELQSRILMAQIEKTHAEQRIQRKELVGTGMRAEKVRTYNYPQNRITDHQANATVKNLDVVMAGGELDPIIEALRKKDREERKLQALEKNSLA